MGKKARKGRFEKIHLGLLFSPLSGCWGEIFEGGGRRETVCERFHLFALKYCSTGRSSRDRCSGGENEADFLIMYL